MKGANGEIIFVIIQYMYITLITQLSNSSYSHSHVH